MNPLPLLVSRHPDEGEGICRVHPEAIHTLCEGIIRGFHPDKAVLFGSDAYGQPNEGSDIDLLVIMPVTGKAPHLAAPMMAELRLVCWIPETIRGA